MCTFFIDSTKPIAPRSPNTLFGYVVCLVVGTVFGFAMNKARVIEPTLIRDQMTFSHFVHPFFFIEF